MYKSLDIEIDGGVGPANIEVAAEVSITTFNDYKKINVKLSAMSFLRTRM